MKLRLYFAAIFVGLLVSCVHLSHHLPSASSELVSREPASVTMRSGYRVGTEMCGSGSLAFPRVAIDTRPGYCVGLVASSESGLTFPRTISQVPGRDQFLVVDMGGWATNKGRVWSLDRDGAGYKLRVLLDQLDQPHGLQFGPDQKAYVGTLTEIFRFDPLASNPANTIEVIIRGLEGRKYRRDDGVVLKHNAHPLKQFIFDREGSLYVNIGAPSDACAMSGKESTACLTSEGARASAAIWKFKPQAAGKPFKTLRAGDPNPSYEILARGLRNSMALAMHPDYPRAGTAFFQGENSRDLTDPDQPHEELNLIEPGKHYGWPYCYNVATTSAEYRDYVSKTGPYQNICANANLYRAPFSVLPPHSAPLGMLYYQGQKFSELRNSLVVGLHGYRPSGNRILFAPVDGNGFPVRQTQATTYRKNCEGVRTSQDENGTPIGGVQFQELVKGWYAVSGLRPLGAPVGLTVADDGAIWVVEDKNKTILRIDVDPSKVVRESASCNQRSEAEINELIGFIENDPNKSQALRDVRVGLIEKHCIGCHSDFNLKPEHSDPKTRDRVVLHFMLSQDGWLAPGDLDGSQLYRRVHAIGPEKPMPAGAEDLLKNNPAYRTVVAKLDELVKTMVPGEAAVVASSSSLRVRNQNRLICGSLPNGTPVTVLERVSKLEGFSRIYRPSSKYLVGDCSDGDQFFVGAEFIRYLPAVARNPQGLDASANFHSRRLTARDEFTSGIEGPAFSKDGYLFVVNHKRQGTIGQVDPKTGVASTFVTLPAGSIANSIRFDSKGRMYLADYRMHRIWRLDQKTKELSIFSENTSMSQPNDLAIAKSGMMFASDPNWKKRTGRIWVVSAEGAAKPLPIAMGTANGIELSPDDKTLYVGESSTNTVWAFTVDGERVWGKRQLIRFHGGEIDGLKADVDGNLYITRLGKSAIAKVSPDGRVVREIALLGKDPTNLTFGGSDGRDIFVTQRDGGFVETFRSDKPGRDWLMR